LREKLYAIPVNDAFNKDCECPLCFMRDTLENDAINFTMGPSYMEDDVRGMTSQLGFCGRHIELMYKHQNRLGLALIIKSYMDKLINDIEKTSKTNNISSKTMFKKKGFENKPKHIELINKLNESCYICSKIENTFDRYIATVFHLYNTDINFKENFTKIKGFCTKHYGLLYEFAPKYLKGGSIDQFLTELNKLYLDNMKRVRDDLDWFIDKFDYRFVNEPWKNSKDALPRSIIKSN